MSPPLDDHDCGWKAYAEQLRAAHDKSIADIREQLAEVKRLLYARKSEKREQERSIRGQARVA